MGEQLGVRLAQPHGQLAVVAPPQLLLVVRGDVHTGLGAEAQQHVEVEVGGTGARPLEVEKGADPASIPEDVLEMKVAVDEGGGAMVAVQRDCAGAHDVGRVGEQRGVDVRETRGLVDELERARRRKLMRALERVAIEEGWPDGGRSVLR